MATGNIPNFPTIPELQTGDCADVTEQLAAYRQAMIAMCEWVENRTKTLQAQIDQLQSTATNGTAEGELTTSDVTTAQTVIDLTEFSSCNVQVSGTLELCRQEQDSGNSSGPVTVTRTITMTCDGNVIATLPVSTTFENDSGNVVCRAPTWSFPAQQCAGVVQLQVDPPGIGTLTNELRATATAFCAS